ncbi:MAG: hypothetical protein AAF734_05200 [Bacteroidota bacterium]
MMLALVRLLFDAGLFVLIWMVQLVVYPSFQYYTKENLLIWHQKYTGQITFIVMPLMLGELIIATLQVFYTPSFYAISTLLMIGIIWANTFFQAIPLHKKIDQQFEAQLSVKKLIRLNWLRTFLWSLVFLMSGGYYLGWL